MWLFGLYTSHNQWIENEVTRLTRVVDTNYQGGMGLLLHIKYKKDYVWNPGDFLGEPLGTFMPNTKG